MTMETDARSHNVSLQTKKARRSGPLSSALLFSAVMAVAMMKAAMTAMYEPDRRQFDVGDPGGDVQPGLPLHADRLQRVGICRTTDQKVAAETDADRSIGADAAIIAGEFAAPDPAGRRIHGPGQPGLVGDPEVEPDAADGCDIGFWTAALALEHAFHAGGRADDEADI